jgi:outer membrane protein OmpA-like peptidoglycan-associated protein
MRVRNTLAIVSTFLCVSGFPLLEKAQAESQTEAIRERAAAVAEEKAEIAKEEAEIAKAAVELEEKKSALAEKKAALAQKESAIDTKVAVQANQLEQELAELKAKETERGLVYTLDEVLFEFNEVELKAEALRKLYPLVTFLKEHPKRDLLIEGHTDGIGSEDYNLQLSQQRAVAVGEFLVSNGITPERITAYGSGKAYPVASNATPAGREQNRRVEVVILREGEKIADSMD